MLRRPSLSSIFTVPTIRKTKWHSCFRRLSCLHPVLDLDVCMGSGACAKACPENAIGIIKGKAVLVNPTHCIGHAACAPACPVGAIRLVFGTAKRGIEIPYVSEDFETNVPGIFIAGELGGMGLIRNAVRQGVQTVETVRKKRPSGKAPLDLLIIGAGPAGIGAALAAKSAGLKYAHIEQEDSFGGTTYHYPRGKLVMTAPLKLPISGEYKLKEVSKERLMEIWNEVVEKGGIRISFSERMEEIIPESDGCFTVRSDRTSYKTSSVLLAIGRRGTPRKLGVKGELDQKVVYRLIEPAQYKGKRVLVVGGGDSALEAAMDCAKEPGAKVILSYRGKAFDRVKPKNRERLDAMVAKKRILQLMESTISEITPGSVFIKHGGEVTEHKNEAVIVCAGGELPTAMLKKIGIKIEAHYGS